MTNQRYVIKLHSLYYNHLGDFTSNIYNAYMAIHSEVARQTIVDKKLGDECRVMQASFVEVEVK